MILDVKTIGTPVLRRKAAPITKADKTIRVLAANMLETMHEEGGVGLAAPQIGQSIRLIVVEYPQDDTVEDSPLATYKLINPEIVWKSETLVKGVEGCLSIPGVVGEVERAESIRVKAQGISGRKTEISASGWLARIFQHEIDHLDGICYIDRAEKVWELSQEEDSDSAEPGDDESVNSCKGDK
jgi:peptide deformylase